MNPLGESILSDAEADQRMRQIEQCIDRADVDYVSVKVSAIVANLDVLAFEHSVERIADRLRRLYRRAADATPLTFVNLDMEEYRDLELTLQSFMRVLDEDEFRRLDAGIVLQAYLPDSHEALERLGAWAVARHAAGGGTTKVRLVKGANLAMEIVEAELHGWIAAPYGSKARGRRQLQGPASSRLCDRNGRAPCGSGSPATTSSMSPGRCACATSSARGTGSTSRCWRGWRRPRRGRCTPPRAVC